MNDGGEMARPDAALDGHEEATDALNRRRELKEERLAVELLARHVEDEPRTGHVLIAQPFAAALLRAARRGCGLAVLALIVGCDILAPPDGWVRFRNLTDDRDIVYAEVVPCGGGPVVVAPTPIRPGEWADTPTLPEGCYDVYAGQAAQDDGAASGGLRVRVVTHEARARIELERNHRYDVRVRP